jgi:hypothetical protein
MMSKRKTGLIFRDFEVKSKFDVKDALVPIDQNESSHVKMQIGGETLEVSGASLKQLAKKSAESKVQDSEAEADAREQQKIADALNQVESISIN